MSDLCVRSGMSYGDGRNEGCEVCVCGYGVGNVCCRIMQK